MRCCGKVGSSYVVVKMDSGGPAVWVEEGGCCVANSECCAGTEHCCVVRRTLQLTFRSRKQWFSGVVSPEMEGTDLKTKLLQKHRSDAG